MLDPQLIRDHVEIVRRRLESRGVDLSATIEDLGKLDSARRNILKATFNYWRRAALDGFTEHAFKK